MGAPAAIAIAFAAASTAVAGASYIEQRRAAKNQFIVDEAAIELNREHARLQAAEQASIHASGFRKALASQVALASMRGGAGSVTRQFTSEAYSNFLQDQEAIKRGVRLSDIQSLNALSEAAAKKRAANVRGFTQFAGTTINAWNSSAITGALASKLQTTFPNTFPKGGK